jgi:acyl-coenzyme A synthetase/AMP-(fatty) acid ligase
MQFSEKRLPLGYVADGAEVMVCDDRGEDVGETGIGEIAVKSRYLAVGYWRQPELTQAVFRPDPSGTDARIYAMGDLGRRVSDGGLEYLGRKDWQVKIRGYRIEVREVERALLDMPAITDAVVIPWEAPERDPRLVAYVVPASAAGVTVSEMRRVLRATLPEYMVPSAFVRLPALPLTPGGKIDRRALPEPDVAMLLPEERFVRRRFPPGHGTPLPSRRCDAWRGLPHRLLRNTDGRDSRALSRRGSSGPAAPAGHRPDPRTT